MFAPLIGIVSVLPPVLGACAWLAAQWLVRRRRPTLAVAIVTVAYGALVWPTLLFGGFPVYACLAVGIVTWSRWLDVREARRRAGRSLAAPAMVVAIAGGEPAADDATAR